MYHVIAIPGKLDCIVEETQEPLSVFYKNHKELFACASELFPVRMTTSCGENKMSYHLHPSDAYALVHEGTRGKASGAVAMEEADKVSERLFGNRAQTLDEFKKMVQEKDWDHLFQKISVKQGDFLHTPAGVIHGGGGEGTMNMTFLRTLTLPIGFMTMTEMIQRENYIFSRCMIVSISRGIFRNGTSRAKVD